ncbi:MAG: hypothetical protein RR420_01340 [Anaerovoracaceae bacterium]
MSFDKFNKDLVYEIEDLGLKQPLHELPDYICEGKDALASRAQLNYIKGLMHNIGMCDEEVYDMFEDDRPMDEYTKEMASIVIDALKEMWENIREDKYGNNTPYDNLF